MERSYFDIATVFLYVVIGLLGVICINAMMKSDPQRKAFVGKQDNRKVSFCCFIFLYTFIAVFRKVAPGIGGSDAMGYISNFETILHGSALEYLLDRKLESGFQLFTSAVRSVFSNYHIYFLIIYGFISFSYIKFIKEKCPRCQTYIPFVLLMYPYLRAFNTIRTSMAVSIIIIALILMDRKKWTSLILMVASFFFHRISILFIFLWPFYNLTKKRFANQTRWQFVVFAFAGIVLSYFASEALQAFVGNSFLLDDRDMNFLMRKADEDHFGRYPLVIGHILLFVAIIWFYNKIRWDDKSVYLRNLFVYDLWIAPAGVILGVWRFVEYFYIVRLSLWCVVFYVFSRGMKGANLKFVKFLYLFLFIAWLVFRVYKEYEAVEISPYIFDFSL